MSPTFVIVVEALLMGPKIANREFEARNSPRSVQFSTRTQSLPHASDVVASSLGTHDCHSFYLSNIGLWAKKISRHD